MRSDSEFAEEDLTILRSRVKQAQDTLRHAISWLCPGPHTLFQHRDGLGPWCPRCGRDDLGYKIGVVTNG